MDTRSLGDVLQSTENLVKRFRETDITEGGVHWSVYREEQTNWIEEQRAWQESCVLMDQSYHLANYYLEGPDAIQLNADLGINSIAGLTSEQAPNAKQHPVCSPEGYVIGDPILFYFGDDEVAVVGNQGLAQKWIQYNAETGDYDVTVTDVYSPYGERPPVDCRFEVQGPRAKAVLEDVIDGPFPDLTFFGMDEISINGNELYILGHGMASVPGYEIFGPYEHHDEIKRRILEVGREFGMRELGAKSYKTAALTTGWLPTGLPAIYDSEEMEGYRQWLDADCVEANWSLGGSFFSEDITDYYLNPVELNYGHFIDLDHNFVGKEPIMERMENPERKKVTFVWNAEDVIDVYASLFSDGDSYKYLQLPDTFHQWDLGHYDAVRKDEELVGLSIMIGYDYNQREVLSLGVIDVEYSEPGTEVSLLWGEENSPKENVEPHKEKEITATVASAPYVRDRMNL